LPGHGFVRPTQETGRGPAGRRTGRTPSASCPRPCSRRPGRDLQNVARGGTKAPGACGTHPHPADQFRATSDKPSTRCRVRAGREERPPGAVTFFPSSGYYQEADPSSLFRWCRGACYRILAGRIASEGWSDPPASLSPGMPMSSLRPRPAAADPRPLPGRGGGFPGVRQPRQPGRRRAGRGRPGGPAAVARR
jgi:hypothetical protein